MMKISLPAALFALALSVPAFAGELAAPRPGTPAYGDDAYCRSLGAALGSEAYVTCRMTLDKQRKDAAREQRHNFFRAIFRGLGAYNAAKQRAADEYRANHRTCSVKPRLGTGNYYTFDCD